MVCVNHPDKETEKKCGECGNYICEECTEMLGETSYCKPCVDKAKENLSTALEDMTKNINWGKALIAGLVVAAIGAVIWDKVAIWFNLQLGLLAIAIGYGVGIAVIWGSGGKRGIWLQILSLIITLTGILGGLFLTVHDVLVQETAKDPTKFLPGTEWISAVIILPFYIIESGFISWVIIAFGLYQGFVLPGMPKIKVK